MENNDVLRLPKGYPITPERARICPKNVKKTEVGCYGCAYKYRDTCSICLTPVDDVLIQDSQRAITEVLQELIPEQVNHPSHYNNYPMEVIDMMEHIWGTEEVITFCEMNAFKYRMRMGLKDNNSIEQDLAKEKWYLNKSNELKNSSV